MSEKAELSRLIGHVSRVGANINQTAKQLNMYSAIDVVEVSNAMADVAELRASIMKAIEKRLKMIIKASARSGARNLANHLASTKDNDHVTIHEVREYMKDCIGGARFSHSKPCRRFRETVSRGRG